MTAAPSRWVLGSLPKLRANLYVNLAQPDQAFRQAQLPCDGVGLARLEFIFASWVGIHPLARLARANLERDRRHRAHLAGRRAEPPSRPRKGLIGETTAARQVLRPQQLMERWLGAYPDRRLLARLPVGADPAPLASTTRLGHGRGLTLERHRPASRAVTTGTATGAALWFWWVMEAWRLHPDRFVRRGILGLMLAIGAVGPIPAQAFAATPAKPAGERSPKRQATAAQRSRSHRALRAMPGDRYVKYVAEQSGRPAVVNLMARRHMTELDGVALRYFALSSNNVNQYLGQQDSMHFQPWWVDTMAAHAAVIADALVRLPARSGIVYRGAIDYYGRLSALEPGQEWTSKTFMSTSTDPRIVRGKFENGIFMKIHAKRGRSIELFAPGAGEKEVVLTRESRFLVLRSERITKLTLGGHTLSWERPKHFLELQEI